MAPISGGSLGRAFAEGASLTPEAGRAVPSVERGLDDGARAVRLTVLVVVLLDALVTPIGQVFGVADLGRTGVLAETQRFLLVAAAAATMWNRPRTAVALTAVVAVLVLTLGITGEELWLLMITGVCAAIWANRRQLGLVLLAQLGWAWGFGWKLNQTYSGQRWPAAAFMMGVALSALGVGLMARWLLQARDRRRERVRELRAAQAEMRSIERARLADELQTLVTHGLGAIDVELDQLARGPGDLDHLRSGLAQVDHRSRVLLNQLRALLDVLRPDPAHDSGSRPAARDAEPGRWVDLATARHVRLAATAVFGLLAARALLGGLSARPDLELVVTVLGLLACAIAVWKPVAAAIGAAAVLTGSAAYHTAGVAAPGFGDLLSTTLLCLIAAVGFGPRRFWLIVVALTGYAGLVAVTEPPDPSTHVVLIGVGGFLATAGGLTARHFIVARRQAVEQLVALTEQRERMESEERGAVARELHDVVAHSLSVTTMLVMATSLSNDADQLAETVDKIRSSVGDAHQELSDLLGAMRSTEPDPAEPASLVPPLVSASGLAQRLGENGFQPDLDIDPAANALDPTTQRTLSRIMQEATTNILRYTPAGSACHFALAVSEAVTRLRIVSPLAAAERGSNLSLGWGLGGIRERVELTEGTFTAGPDRGRWVVDITLPTSQEPAATGRATLSRGVGRPPVASGSAPRPMEP